MKQTLYIAEPEAIDMALVRDRLEAAGYEIIKGNPNFSGQVPPHVTTLLVRSRAHVTPAIKTIFPKLTSVVRVGTGLDTIDVEFCKANGISVYSAPGANARAVSEYTVMTMLVALRKFNTLIPADVASWNRFKFRGRSLKEQTIGIVGFGAVGRLVYENLSGFGCKAFYAYDPYLTQDKMPAGIRLVSLEEMIGKVNIMTIHVPLTDETKDLFDQAEFDRMRSGSVLINVSRGGIVNERSAAEAAASKGVIYVADVVEGEPRVHEALLGSDNIIVTPHIASLTDAAEAAMVEVAVDNFLLGKPTVASTAT